MDRVDAYEGNKPYIFISYAHRDSDKVLPIILKLTERGYRIWYDDGIAPGSEWPEYIAQHLGNSAVLMSFISERYIESNNCKRELTYGLSKNIPFLGIIMEPTKMSMGMEMQLSAQQCILKYNYATEERFIDKICSTPDLQLCKEEDLYVEVYDVAEEEITEEKKLPEKMEKKREKKNPGKKKAKGKKRSLGIAMILFIILLGGAIHLFSGEGEIEITEKHSVKSDATSLFLLSTTMNQDMVKKIGWLDKLKILNFKECDMSTVDLSDLATKDQIETILFEKCTGLKDFHFLEGYTHLRKIVIKDSDITNDSISLDMIPFSHLTIENAPNFTDLHAVIGDGNKDTIKEMVFINTGVSNIDLLASCPSLKKVVGDGSAVTNIDSLASLDKLTEISFNDCKIGSVTKEFQSLRLLKILLGNNKTKDFSGFQNCAAVSYIDISGAFVETVPDFVEKSMESIKSIDMSNLSDPSVQQEILKELLPKAAKLESLKASGATLPKDVNWKLANQLKILDLSNAGIEGSLDLSDCKKLKEIYLSDNNIKQLLLNLNMEEKVENLDLKNNNMEDLSGLGSVKINHMYLNGNEMSAKSIFDQMKFECYGLHLDYDESILQLDKDTIKSKVNRVLLANVPKDQIVKLDVLATVITIEE